MKIDLRVLVAILAVLLIVVVLFATGYVNISPKAANTLGLKTPAPTVTPYTQTGIPSQVTFSVSGWDELASTSATISSVTETFYHANGQVMPLSSETGTLRPSDNVIYMAVVISGQTGFYLDPTATVTANAPYVTSEAPQIISNTYYYYFTLNPAVFPAINGGQSSSQVGIVLDMVACPSSVPGIANGGSTNTVTDSAMNSVTPVAETASGYLSGVAANQGIKIESIGLTLTVTNATVLDSLNGANVNPNTFTMTIGSGSEAQTFNLQSYTKGNTALTFYVSPTNTEISSMLLERQLGQSLNTALPWSVNAQIKDFTSSQAWGGVLSITFVNPAGTTTSLTIEVNFVQ
jgi:hypothetical protein